MRVSPEALRGTKRSNLTVVLKLRIFQHKHGLGSKFTQKYDIKKLVYCEEYDDINEALAREKQIKAGSRKKKEILINAFNPSWKDLSGN